MRLVGTEVLKFAGEILGFGIAAWVVIWKVIL
jgi:hypothetical protein